ncbi:hypothetical protein LFM09_12545 [Lentzea alba]|uniref:hypothetical protein n=1 Tax=Lentzea alba TaxID=2714351 RepID=UPI0039BFA4FC
MRSLYRLAAVAAVSAGIVTAGATVASADTAAAGFKTTVEVGAMATTCILIEKTNGDDVAQGCFKSDGDHVTAWDKEADGLWVRVDWLTDYDRDGACVDKSSEGSAVDCNYNMDEDGRLKFQVELWDGDKRYAETGWTGWLAI